MRPAIRSALLAAFAVQQGVQQPGCVCNTEGREGGLAINVDHGNIAGRYRLEVVASNDGLISDHTATLALDFEVTATGVTCTSIDPEIGLSCYVTGGEFYFGEDHFFGDQQGFFQAVVGTSEDGDYPPDRATVRLLDASGAVLAEQAVDPSFEREGGCNAGARASTIISVPRP
jgi:hypothetical protein